MSRNKVKVVKALVVEVGGINRTYRDPAQATIAIVGQMIWRLQWRDKTQPWTFERRDRVYKRAYPRVNKIVKRMMGEA